MERDQVAALIKAGCRGKRGEGEDMGSNLGFDRARQRPCGAFQPVIKGLAVATDRRPDSNATNSKGREEGCCHKCYNMRPQPGQLCLSQIAGGCAISQGLHEGNIIYNQGCKQSSMLIRLDYIGSDPIPPQRQRPTGGGYGEPSSLKCAQFL
jgi:hypothetical protein